VRKADIAPPNERRADVPAELTRIVTKAVQKEPSDRYPSAHDMGQDLWAFLYSLAPSFTSQRLADLMVSLFDAEQSRHVVGAVTARSGDTGPVRSPARMLTAMSREDFSPDVTKSVLFEGSEDATRNDLLPYVRDARAGAAGGDPTIRPGGLPGARPAVGRPNQLPGARPVAPALGDLGFDLDSGDDDATVVSKGGGHGWDDATLVDAGMVLGAAYATTAHAADPRGGRPGAALSAGAHPGEMVATAPQKRAPVGRPEEPTNPEHLASGATDGRSRPTEPDKWAATTEPRSPSGRPLHPFPSPPGAFPEAGLPSGPSDPFQAQPPLPFDTYGIPVNDRGPARRWPIILLVVFVAALAGGGFAAGVLIARPDRPPPVLRVISVPEGASVSLDTREVNGLTPLEISGGLTVGRNHLLRVSKTGYETWSTTFQPSHGLVEQIAVLAPRRVAVTVRTEPPGGLVRVDGVLVGTAPIELPSVQVGKELAIQAEHRDHGRAARTFVVPDEPGAEVVLRLP
jgi:hypothetical protein